MFLLIAVILILLWASGNFVFHLTGDLIQFLLTVALVGAVALALYWGYLKVKARNP